MFKNIINFVLLSFLFLLLQSCASGWYTLQLPTENQPIQFGPHHLTVPVDTLGIISGKSAHELEEETYSESEYTSVAFGGTDEISENIDSTLYSALDDHPQHFIADGEYRIKIEHGISFSTVIFGMIASWITDEDAEYGTYTIETIKFKGVVYKMSEPEE